MTNELEAIPQTSEGWPYLPDAAYVHDVPAYTQKLAAALADFEPSPSTPEVDTGWVDARTIFTLNPAPAWLAPAAAYGYRVLSYRRVGTEVELSGLLTAPTAVTNGAQTVFTIPINDPNTGMPIGLRPSATHQSHGALGTNNTAITATISAAGVVQLCGTWAAGPVGISIRYRV